MEEKQRIWISLKTDEIQHHQRHKRKWRLPKMPKLRLGVGSKKKLLYFGKILVLVVVVGFVLWQIYRHWYNSQIFGALSGVKTYTHDEALKQKPLQEVNRFYTFPKNQKVTVGEINDIKTLTGKQNYFAKARKGDLLVIYPNMTLIYDPASHSLVDFAMVHLLK